MSQPLWAAEADLDEDLHEVDIANLNIGGYVEGNGLFDDSEGLLLQTLSCHKFNSITYLVLAICIKNCASSGGAG